MGRVCGIESSRLRLLGSVAITGRPLWCSSTSVESRSSDHIARIDRTRFAILLTETDEIAAINFVERVRAACESVLRAPDLVRIGIGWASPAGSTDLRAAIDVAEARVADELETPS